MNRSNGSSAWAERSYLGAQSEPWNHCWFVCNICRSRRWWFQELLKNIWCSSLEDCHVWFMFVLIGLKPPTRNSQRNGSNAGALGLGCRFFTCTEIFPSWQINKIISEDGTLKHIEQDPNQFHVCQKIATGTCAVRLQLFVVGHRPTLSSDGDWRRVAEVWGHLVTGPTRHSWN